MDRYIMNINQPHRSVVERVEYGKKDSVPLDQSAVQSFNIDPVTGRPMYDLTCIIKAQNKAEQERLIANMTQFDSNFLPDDLSNEDALKYSYPRYAQMPSELAELTEKFAHQKFEEWRQQKQIEDEEQAKKDYEEYLESLKKKKVESKESNES